MLTDCARQVYIGQEISEVSFFHPPLYILNFESFLELIEHEGHGDSDWQLNVDLAHLIGHWYDDQEILGSILFILIFSVNAGSTLPVLARKWRIIEKLEGNRNYHHSKASLPEPETIAHISFTRF